MKRFTVSTLVLLLMFALLTGCSGTSGNATPTNTPDSVSPGGTAAPAPEVDEGPYHLAAGKQEIDEKGFPVEKYVYDRPLCEDDSILTDRTTCYTPHHMTGPAPPASTTANGRKTPRSSLT